MTFCCCTYFATEPCFTGMLLKFRCIIHGAVELNRKNCGFMPDAGTPLPSVPSVPYPNVPYVQPSNPWSVPCTCTRSEVEANGKCWPREPEGFITGNRGTCC